MSENEALKIIPLGGVGDVTKNMYIYEYGDDILVVDCGVGFPDEGMPGVDLIIPDVSSLLERKHKVKGIVLTHGHEDHIGALPYILPKLNVPVFATRLTAGLAEVKLKEWGLEKNIQVVKPQETLELGVFKIDFAHITHSVPDASALIIHTPVGTIFHAADFKFDWTPVDGQLPEVGRIAEAGKKGVLCLLSDCLRSEKPGYTPSEQMIEETFEKELRKCEGKFIVTTQSSNISRLQQAINVSLRHNRKISFIGRSLEQSVEVAQKLGFLKIEEHDIVSPEALPRYPEKEITLLVAGSQGQASSALSRIAHGDHRFVKIKPRDVVVFSSDPIPGNENAVNSLIDTLTKRGANVSYSDILEDVHVSGHGAAGDLMLMIGLTQPKYIIPIGGTFRHIKQYSRLAQGMGYPEDKIILAEDGDIIEFSATGQAHIDGKVEVQNVLVDGLGIGDIGEIVLRDRKMMSADGIVVLIVPVDQATGQVVAEPDVVSRGFVYMKQSGKLIEETKSVVKECLAPYHGRVLDWQFLRRNLEGSLEKFFYQKTKRKPLILPVVVEV
ncbi:ribonuclease J [Candidatus Microgenomates bacterium]|nr:ribonuclease J [Candidatus Microgenomates bacterium]